MFDEAVVVGVAAFREGAEPPSDDEVMSRLAEAGVEGWLAERLLILLPLAYGRRVLPGVQFADTFLDGETERPLAGEPVYVAAVARAALAGRDDIERIGLRSSEFHAVNNALHAGSRLEDLRLGRPALARPLPTPVPGDGGVPSPATIFAAFLHGHGLTVTGPTATSPPAMPTSTANRHADGPKSADQHVDGVGQADQRVHDMGQADQHVDGVGQADQRVHDMGQADQHVDGVGQADQRVHGMDQADQHVHRLVGADQHVHGMPDQHGHELGETGLLVGDAAFSVRLFAHPSPMPGVVMAQVDIGIDHPALAQPWMVESCAGAGHTWREAIHQAMTMVERGVVHPIVEALLARGAAADQVSWETYEHPSGRFELCLGAQITLFTAEPVPSAGPLLDRLLTELRDVPLSPAVHALRIFTCHQDGRLITNELLLDGEPWEAGARIVEAVPPPLPSGMVGQRLFGLLVPAGQAAHADPVGRAVHADPVGRAADADPVGRAVHADPVGRAADADPVGRAVHADPVGRAVHADPVGRAVHADPVGRAVHADHVGRAVHADHAGRAVHADRAGRA